ncbi:MAG: hypothetical protein L0H64_16295, partial [Pseudonocardia sp.]|nr:hypothetical protein [Pseudonocardia sp.]
MTESEPHGGDPGDGDYPDGSVGRYVRERWGAAPPSRKTRPYVPPVQPESPPESSDDSPAGSRPEQAREERGAAVADSSLPLRPAPPEPGRRGGRLDALAGEADVAAWAERGRTVAVTRTRPPGGTHADSPASRAAPPPAPDRQPPAAPRPLDGPPTGPPAS